MKVNRLDEPIHIVKEQAHAWSVIDDIVHSEDREYPFYVCDANDIIKKYKMWKTSMPRIEPHYAVKCNDHPVVLKVISALGLGFDCASKSEIDKVLALGVDPSRIIYAHTAKPPSHLRHAAKVNVDLVTFDNELELQKIKNLHPNTRTVIRIKNDAKSAICKLGRKFGCDPKTEAHHLLSIARNLGIEVLGVSFHIGWGCRDPSIFHSAIEAARYVFDIAYTLGYNFKLLDIGGGFPGEMDDSIEKFAKVINPAVEEFFPDTSIRVISEPGTFFVDSAFHLASNVHSAKKAVIEDPISGEFTTLYHYYLNDGVFCSLSCIISANVVKIPIPLKKYPNSKQYPSIVWGPTCDSTDLINGDMLLPKMQLGDWVVFKDMGAYTLTICTPFNGFEYPTVHSIINQKNWSLLRNKSPFVEEDFVHKCENVTSKIDTDAKQEKHFQFPENSFVKG